MVQFVHCERKNKKKASFPEEIKVCAVPSEGCSFKGAFINYISSSEPMRRDVFSQGLFLQRGGGCNSFENSSLH